MHAELEGRYGRAIPGTRFGTASMAWWVEIRVHLVEPLLELTELEVFWSHNRTNNGPLGMLVFYLVQALQYLLIVATTGEKSSFIVGVFLFPKQLEVLKVIY